MKNGSRARAEEWVQRSENSGGKFPKVDGKHRDLSKFVRPQQQEGRRTKARPNLPAPRPGPRENSGGGQRESMRRVQRGGDKDQARFPGKNPGDTRGVTSDP